MSEELKCIGAKEVKIEYLEVTHPYFVITYYQERNGVVYPATEPVYDEDGQYTGSVEIKDKIYANRYNSVFTWKWIENLEGRTYIVLGTFKKKFFSECDITGYFASRAVYERDKDKAIDLFEVPPIFEGGRIQQNYHIPTSENESIPYVSTPRHPVYVHNYRRTLGEISQVIYQRLIDDINLLTKDYGSNFNLSHADECFTVFREDIEPPFYGVAANDVIKTHIVQTSNSIWQIQILEDGSSIFLGRNWIGNNRESPGTSQARVAYSGRRFRTKEIVLSKQQGTGIKINNNGIDFFLEEINPDNEQIVNSQFIASSTDKMTLTGFNIFCVKTCPDNTCSVDCGDKICCYGSDGIAVDFYYK